MAKAMKQVVRRVSPLVEMMKVAKRSPTTVGAGATGTRSKAKQKLVFTGMTGAVHPVDPVAEDPEEAGEEGTPTRPRSSTPDEAAARPNPSAGLQPLTSPSTGIKRSGGKGDPEDPLARRTGGSAEPSPVKRVERDTLPNTSAEETDTRYHDDDDWEDFLATYEQAQEVEDSSTFVAYYGPIAGRLPEELEAPYMTQIGRAAYALPPRMIESLLVKELAGQVLSLIHISEPPRPELVSRMPSSA